MGMRCESSSPFETLFSVSLLRQYRGTETCRPAIKKLDFAAFF
jgi:hypothetical protein